MYNYEQENTLVLAAQAGDRNAFGQLYDAIFPGLYGYARSRLASTVDAEDLVSETMLTVIQKLLTFHWRHPGAFRAWVFQIARRKLADFYRRNPLPVESVDEIDIFPDSSHTPEMQFLQNETRAGLMKLVGSLSPRKQEVVLLRYNGGLQNSEIAAVLGRNERTVSAHLTRALDRLKAGPANRTGNLFLLKEHAYD